METLTEIIAHIQKENESIGSGNEKINSPFKTEVKFQIRYSF